jgi:hemolysin activation/secretion protein
MIFSRLQISAFIAVSCLSFMVPLSAHAATARSPTVDPSRIGTQQPPLLPPIQKSVTPSLRGGGALPAIKAPAGADKIRFTLKDISIAGVSAYAPGQFEHLYAPLRGKEVTVADIYAVAAEITARYHKDGYILSRAVIPAQAIAGGHVQIAVTEGYIQNVHLAGVVPSNILIAGIVAQIKGVRPLNIHALERAMLLLNLLPGQEARAVLTPIPIKDAAPGAIDLTITFDKKPPQFIASLNNDGSRYIGPWQIGGTAIVPHTLLYWGETTFTLYTAVPTSELAYAALSERIPLTASGLEANLTLQANHSVPGSDLAVLDLKNRFKSAKVELHYPLILTRDVTLTPYISFEMNDSQSRTDSSRLYHDRLSVVRLGYRQQLADRYQGTDAYNLSLSQGLNLLGARETGSADLSRANGRSDFTKINIDATRTQSLGSWPFNLKIGLSGQYAFSPLLSSEEIGYGGMAFGRAYDNADIAGDSGIEGMLELAYNPLHLTDGVAVQPFLFYDIAKLWNRGSGALNPSGASTGGGFRASLFDNAFLSATMAQPLTRRQTNPLYGNGKNPRFTLSLQYSF